MIGQLDYFTYRAMILHSKQDVKIHSKVRCMCGIIAIASTSNVVDKLLQGLSELEYRGYDSSGVALLEETILCHKVTGSVKRLNATIDKNVIKGSIGIAHNRWATHGPPSIENAHPHATDKVAVVHNGIIENLNELRALLKSKHNISYKTGTDTEVITLLITEYLKGDMAPLESVWKTTKLLRGSFTFAVLLKKEKAIIAVKKGSPLLLGYMENNDMIISSDHKTLSLFTNNLTYLEDYDLAYIKHNKCLIYDKNLALVKREKRYLPPHESDTTLNNYPNYMFKEIIDQTYTIEHTLNEFYINKKIIAPKINTEVTIVACGSSYFAALIAKYWLRSVGLIVQIEIASEFIYQNSASSRTILFISQSGETIDILAGLQHAKSQNHQTIGLTNTRNSSLARNADIVLYTAAGNEIGVASTKTFTAQLIALQCLSIAQRNDFEVSDYLHNVQLVSQHAKEFLNQHNDIHKAVELLLKAKNVMYIGRGTSYGLAMEGALKLKELSYIPAEGIAAGELKHGTLALVDETVIIVALIPYNQLFYKTYSNIQEIVARGGQVIAVSNNKGARLLSDICTLIIEMPTIDGFFSPVLYALPMQLIAYYTAIKIGNDVDRPRNLAKSVTVE